MDNRNLWGEAKAADAESRRRTIENVARILYVVIVAIGGLVALSLYTRPDNWTIKVFGALAAMSLVAADITWAWATHYSAAGGQRMVARAFWGLSLFIYGMNVISEYLYYLGRPLGIFENWYYIGSISTVIVAAFGLAWYLMLSPEQKLDDVRSKAQLDAVNAVLRGIEKPSPETLGAFNESAGKAAHELSTQAAKTILGYVSPNGNGAKPVERTLHLETIPNDPKPRQ